MSTVNPTSPSGDLFALLDEDGDGEISSAELEGMLAGRGIEMTDPRFAQVKSRLDAIRRTMTPAIDSTRFGDLFGSGLSLLRKAVQNQLVIPDFQQFRNDVEHIFDAQRSNDGGEVATYIPQLANVGPSLYGLSVTTVDGQRMDMGDSDTAFCVQSSFKPLGYCLALEEHGPEGVHNHVGREPSGRSFNELALNHEGKPHNPMINAGAVMSCALIQPQAAMADRFDHLLSRWRKACGNESVGFSNSVYQSERTTADRNFALGYLMREQGAFPPDTDLMEVLDFYFQCCSIEVTTRSMSVAAATLANGGVCPTTGEQVFSPDTVKSCLSLMLSCGMYDFSGEFAFSFGIPAKSGVSGVIIGVVPNTLGFAVYSPRLDRIGNSVRGLNVCRGLMNTFNFHMFDSLAGRSAKRDPRRGRTQDRTAGVTQMIWAASVGDLDSVRQRASRGVDLGCADYDLRTPLHLAAAEGHRHVVEFLLRGGVNSQCKDRWGHSPQDEAKRHGHHEIVELLSEQSLGQFDKGELSCVA